MNDGRRAIKTWVNGLLRVAQKNPFVAVVDGEIVGMAEIETDGFIDHFYVHPKWQGRGIGKALLAALEAEVAELGVGRIFADVSVTAKSFFLAQAGSIKVALSRPIHQPLRDAT